MNLKNGSLEKRGQQTLHKDSGDIRTQGTWGDAQKREEDEEDNLAPFRLSTHLRLGLWNPALVYNVVSMSKHEKREMACRPTFKTLTSHKLGQLQVLGFLSWGYMPSIWSS